MTTSNLDSIRRAVYALASSAKSPDEVEDYFHDSVETALKKRRNLGHWIYYIYSSVRRRIGYGREYKQHIQLNEELALDEVGDLLAMQIDVKRALARLSPKRQAYIYDYFYNELTLEEIATKYKVSNQVVSKLIQRGLGEMRELLQGYNPEEDTHGEDD